MAGLEDFLRQVDSLPDEVMPRNPTGPLREPPTGMFPIRQTLRPQIEAAASAAGSPRNNPGALRAMLNATKPLTLDSAAKMVNFGGDPEAVTGKYVSQIGQWQDSIPAARQPTNLFPWDTPPNAAGQVEAFDPKFKRPTEYRTSSMRAALAEHGNSVPPESARAWQANEALNQRAARAMGLPDDGSAIDASVQRLEEMAARRSQGELVPYRDTRLRGMQAPNPEPRSLSSDVGHRMSASGPGGEISRRWQPAPPPPPEPLTPGTQEFLRQQQLRGDAWDALGQIERPARVPVTEPFPVPKVPMESLTPGMQDFLRQQQLRGDAWDALGKIQRPARVPVAQPFVPGPTLAEDLGTLRDAVQSGASKVYGAAAKPFNYVGAKVMANPTTAAGARVAGYGLDALRKVAPYLGPIAALYEAGDKDAQPDVVEQALGASTLNQRMHHMLDAEKRGDYGTVVADQLKNAGQAAYTSVGKPFVGLGNLLLEQVLGPVQAPQLNADQTKAKIAEMAKGASLIDDNDMSNPIKNAARYEQIKAQREQRLQNEPTMNVRLRQAEGPMQDGSEPAQREVRLLADEVRNSPLRAEIMRAGVPSSGHVMGPDPADRRNGAGAGGPTDFEQRMLNYAARFNRDQVPLAERNALFTAFAHANGDDSLSGYHNAAALKAFMDAQPKPKKEGELAQQDANSLREDFLVATRVLRNPNATQDQKMRAQALLDEINARVKFDRNIYHSGDPNDPDVAAELEAIRRQKLGLP